MPTRTNELFAFIRERHFIWQKRQAGNKKPWTKDKILQQYRFCNVYRELDTVTEWIAKNWREPHASDRHLWFAMVVARLLNWPATLETLGYPVPWDKRMQGRFARLGSMPAGTKVFSGAYIVSTNGHAMPKVPYLMQYVLDPLWKDREVIAHRIFAKDATLASVHSKLREYNGLGSFMAAQVIADIKYEGALLKVSDWHTWAASGPGSRRGLNRVCGVDRDASWVESRWLTELQNLHVEINKLVAKEKMPVLHAQDLQNCLCEFDKYERTRLVEGKPRSKYPGTK